MRFDFLHDPPPAVFERVRSLRIARHLYAVSAACCVLLVFAPCAYGIEALRVDRALGDRRQAQEQFDASTAALAAAKIASQNLDDLIALDRRLRSIRSSGAILASRAADIGNSMPHSIALSSLSVTADGYSIQGRALSMTGLRMALTDLSSVARFSAGKLVRVRRESSEPASAMTFEFGAGVAL
jgi:Tfp pilus assembly protein PilN